MSRLRTILRACVLAAACVWLAGEARAAFEVKSADLDWQQTAPAKSFTVCMEREELTAVDKVSRMVFAVQVGKEKDSPKLDALSVAWTVTQGERAVATGGGPVRRGMLDVSFSLAGLTPGRYDVTAELRQGTAAILKGATFFRIVDAPPPAQQGRIALILPRGVPVKSGTWPVHFGIPFPKGALWREGDVRIISADGAPVPAHATVRSRWGHTPESSIRWLGVDFQPASAPAYWPERKEVRYYLEFGPDAKPAAPAARVRVSDTPEGISVDTGVMQFLVRRSGFNLVDQVRINGRSALQGTPKDGLYLVDHEGATYRAANDRETKLAVEEQGGLRTVIRAEGWYVKDGTDGARQSYALPTDKLCKFITRIEAYAGKPYVRVLSTWVLTFDNFSVRLRDVGFSLPVEGCAKAEFGVEGGAPLTQTVPADGVRLVQRLPDAFVVEDGAGKERATGKRSAGWVNVAAKNGLVSVGHRETWQRFPKEIEVLPDALRFHVWPAHGRVNPEVKTYPWAQINRLWYCHQGRELNLAMPWEYYFATAQIQDNPSAGIYSPSGMAMAGVHSSSLGMAVTSDVMLAFADAAQADALRDSAECFQAAPHALADPKWTCASLAMGWQHPYDPDRMKPAEEAISDFMRGYSDIQDSCGEWGMWLYRPWHHTSMREPGRLELYRLYNATHHYDAAMPWLLYARSGDPFYLTQGSANMRYLTDMQVIHYDDPSYPVREFHFRQGRIAGSTKHTNGFNPWGADHAILAHLTCYNSMILAYYLTGDLRYREVVVDEWQKTLVSDRMNPEYARADRTQSVEGATMAIDFNGARDVTNALGEVIDLYQLTCEPRLLAVMAPMLNYFLNKHMRPWGQPVHNVVLFYGSEQARRQIADGVAAYRRTNGKLVVDDPVTKTKKEVDDKHFWYTHAPFENFAIHSILDPKSNAHIDAWLSADVPRVRARAAEFRKQVPAATSSFCSVPDWVVYMPRVMYAVVRAGGDVSLSRMAGSQAAPICDTKAGGWLRCVVRKDKAEPFDVTILGKVAEGGMPVKVFGPDNKQILDATAPAGVHAPYVIPVNDARTGEFAIFLKARDAKDDVFVPLTTLPEVYPIGYWSQHMQTRFFTRSRGDKPEKIDMMPHRARASFSADDQTQLAHTDKGERITLDVGPGGVWLITQARYANSDSGLILAVSPDRWFAPSPDKMALKP